MVRGIVGYGKLSIDCMDSFSIIQRLGNEIENSSSGIVESVELRPRLVFRTEGSHDAIMVNQTRYARTEEYGKGKKARRSFPKFIVKCE